MRSSTEKRSRTPGACPSSPPSTPIMARTLLSSSPNPRSRTILHVHFHDPKYWPSPKHGWWHESKRETLSLIPPNWSRQALRRSPPRWQSCRRHPRDEESRRTRYRYWASFTEVHGIEPWKRYGSRRRRASPVRMRDISRIVASVRSIVAPSGNSNAIPNRYCLSCTGIRSLQAQHENASTVNADEHAHR